MASTTADTLSAESSSDPHAAESEPSDTDPARVPSSSPTSATVSPGAYLLRAALVMVSALTLGLVLFLTLISGIEHQVRQAEQYSRLRAALAAGTAPTGQTDVSGKHLLGLGTPVALLEIPSIHLHEVVGEGTTAEVLTSGPGHRRDTPLPGQPGTSVIIGRQAAYGGPFKHVHQLKTGATINVTIGFGTNTETFKVIDVRRAGDPRPPALRLGASRLTLVTAAGTPFLSNALVYVDANKVGPPEPASPMVITSPSQLLSSEPAGATDAGTLWALVFWLQALLIVTVGATWSWYRWGHAQTWIVFTPLSIVVVYFVSDQVTRLLPNVM